MNMGYLHYTVTRGGQDIEAGYGVEAVCEEEGCTEQIDRGFYYLCGDKPGGDERGCGGYYCASDLHIVSDGDWTGQLCKRCAADIPDEDEED